jgi:hypothetical protein
LDVGLVVVVIACVVGVGLNRFKFFLFINGVVFVIVNKYGVAPVDVVERLALYHRPSHYLPKPHP